MFKKKKTKVLVNSFTNTENYIYKDSDTELKINTTKSLIKENILNWDKNRSPDNSRIYEISKYYLDNDIVLVPGTISCYKQDDKYVVYDGIHRLMAAYIVNKELTFILSIKKDCEEDAIVKDFININKSVNVPNIYLERTEIVKKLVCENVAKELCKLYPRFVSPSRNPFAYNFNRDNIVEFISTLDIDFNTEKLEEKIIKRLITLNSSALIHTKKKNITVPKKCVDYNFYLFYLNKMIIKNEIEKHLTTTAV